MRDMEKKRANDRDRIRRLSNAATAVEDPTALLRKRVRELERELNPLREAELHRRAEAAELERAVAKASASRWNFTRKPPKKGPGTPVLFLSDLHLNETIKAEQVFGANAFSPDIARARLRETFETAVDLATNHMVNPSYMDGIFVPVGGDIIDLLQGTVHRDERQSNPRMMDAAEQAANALEPGFLLLADAFGHVYSPWVRGNHGRLTAKLSFHDTAAVSLEKAVFLILEGRLRHDKRFHFEFAPGPRLVFTMYPGTEAAHRYMLLHGDPASGMPNVSDSEAGFVNTVARGMKRLRALHSQLGLPFDTMLVGHFHSYGEIPGGGLMNGSLPGFSEYANGRGFGYEAPRQAFWFHHPKYGITCRWPIYVGKGEKKEVA